MCLLWSQGPLRGSYSLRTHLLAFGLAIVIPVVALAAVLFMHGAELDRAQLETRSFEVAAGTADGADREVERDLTILRTLATLPSAANSDWRSFYDEAKSAAGNQAYVTLVDTSMHQRVNTILPYGAEPLLTSDPETTQRVVATKMPGISGFFISQAMKKPAFAVSIPILKDGQITYVLSMVRRAAELRSVVESQVLGSEWIAAIVDRNGTVLASSFDHDRYVGTRPSMLSAAPALPSHTVRRIKGLREEDVLSAIVHGRISGWSVVAELPVAAAEAPLRYALLQWGAISAVALVLTGSCAWLFARAMAQPMSHAADAARALGQGEPIERLSSSLAEANTIVSALKSAGAELTERADHQRLLLRELTHRVKNLMSIIQAIAQRTFSDERSTGEARDLFMDRLRALARAHDVLIQTDWKGAQLKDIVATELAPFSARVHIEGPPVSVGGKFVQTIALVVHELATNAAKYGALSSANGTVSVTWSVTGEATRDQFKFLWQERGGPEVGPPSRSGFGTMLLTNAFASEDVKPRFAYLPAGFSYDVSAPLTTITGECTTFTPSARVRQPARVSQIDSNPVESESCKP